MPTARLDAFLSSGEMGNGSRGSAEEERECGNKASLLRINLAAMRLQVLNIVSHHCRYEAKDAADGCLPGAALIRQDDEDVEPRLSTSSSSTRRLSMAADVSGESPAEMSSPICVTGVKMILIEAQMAFIN
uniref:HDC17301 n=1 Tax=Drosophila melanogaster TaxID=7227 RepID=Q6IIR5_DROME|nr:TPA_inf: HDC17301 [Drosophila melanogaster]